MANRLFLTLTLLLGLAGWAHCQDAIPPEVLRAFADHMGTQMASWQAAADKHFPKPSVLIEYERILDAYDAGRLAEELPNAEKLAAQPVILGSAGEWAKDSDVYYEAYLAGRLIPARAVIRRIWAANCDYADGLAAQGKTSEALRVLLVNLSIARQITHIEPTETCCIINGNGLYRATCLRMGKLLDAMGDKARAKRTRSCAEQSRRFLNSRLHPCADEGMRRSRAFERELAKLPEARRDAYACRKSLDFIRADALTDQRLIKQWDAEVDTVAAKQLVKELRKLTQDQAQKP